MGMWIILFHQGVEDEQSLFKKANNKMLYMNLSSIALKRLREKTSKEQSSFNIPCSGTKKTSPSGNKGHSTKTMSPIASSKAIVHEKKAKKTESAKPLSGTYYLDEIFKTSVNMEMHQKTKLHSSTNHDGSTTADNSVEPVSTKDCHSGTEAERSTSKAKRPLSFDSALQKMDRKLISKRDRLRSGSPSLKKQLESSKAVLSSQSAKGSGSLCEEMPSSSTEVTTKPSSQLIQKLVDKGFAKVKAKSNVSQVSHPTNRISNKFVKSIASGSRTPVDQNEQADKLKAKPIRQISVVANRSSPVASPISELVSTNTTTTSPTIATATFYSSKVSKPAKIKINIKSNPKSTPVLGKTEKQSTSSPNYSILKKKEVILTGIVLI